MKKHILSAIAAGMLFLASVSTVSAQWNLTGNAGTDPVTNFVGTTDAQDLVFRTGNIEYLRLFSTGSLRLQAPTAQLRLNNNSSMFGGTYMYFDDHGTNRFWMGVASYPACGSGLIKMFPAGTGAKGISFNPSGSIVFGAEGYSCAGPHPSGVYQFDDRIGAPSLMLASGAPMPAFPSGYRLAVKGKIICEELKIQLSSSWPDYVFSNNYTLKSLNEVEKFIEENKHLPDVPSASEIENNGVEMGEMARIQMQKIEELTLYTIEMNKRLQQVEKENEELKKKIDLLEQK